MLNHSALQELTKKLDEIKESWQIYTIFEEEKKRFNEEFDALKKDKASLMESFNDISAKNALLLAENKELEQKNKALKEEIASKKQQLQSLDSDDKPLHSNISNPKTLIKQSQTLKEILSSAKELLQKNSLVRPKALQKLEVSYQKHQRLLANPAKEYVTLESATIFFDLLIKLKAKLKEMDLQILKLDSEIQDLQKPSEDIKDSHKMKQK
ncbi:30S ribosomal protein S19 [Helicobacter rodentium]|uniref:30S ribosomal protein S19 n=1 Tax=Helicobacter rodentium TaxID=59617 RepID=UPI000479DACE|nr:30S ribosomal protein S19 [Helicobacter rodentium]